MYYSLIAFTCFRLSPDWHSVWCLVFVQVFCEWHVVIIRYWPGSSTVQLSHITMTCSNFIFVYVLWVADTCLVPRQSGLDCSLRSQGPLTSDLGLFCMIGGSAQCVCFSFVCLVCVFGQINPDPDHPAPVSHHYIHQSILQSINQKINIKFTNN